MIDPYEFYDEYAQNARLTKDMEKTKKKAIKRLKRFENKTEWIFKYSSDAIDEIKEKVDFIYLDGNHDYKYVKEDLEKYWEILKVGGIISGHDINLEGVSKAVIEFIKKNDFEIRFGNKKDWWIIK